jgi:RNA polymerase sigma factor (sigma-70 family)
MSTQKRALRIGAHPRLRFANDDRLVSLVRRGDPSAFEVLYDRHVAELLSFCRYMLGSQHDAEDAVQATFVSAHRALLADERDVKVRPWLFAIARNACLSAMRQRRCEGDVDRAPDQRADPVARMEQREDLEQMLETMLGLPERQRAALVLAELHGLSQAEIGALMGIRPEQVKSYVFQARASLISERRARSTDCREIRGELATARGAGLLRSHLRRHLRFCAGCQEYALELASQRKQLGALLPLVPSIALKRRALQAVLGKSPGAGVYASGQGPGAALTGGGVELLGGSFKALIVKVLAGVACLGAASTAGVQLLEGPAGQIASSGQAAGSIQLAASVRVAKGPGISKSSPPRPSRVQTGSTGPSSKRSGSSEAPHSSQQWLPEKGAAAPGHAETAASGVAAGTAQAAHAKSNEDRGNGKGERTPNGGKGKGHGGGAEARGKGKSEAPGKSERVHGKSQEAHGTSTLEAAQVTSGERAPGGSVEAHGNSEAAHAAEGSAEGKSEESHGKSEEAHSKGS